MEDNRNAQAIWKGLSIPNTPTNAFLQFNHPSSIPWTISSSVSTLWQMIDPKWWKCSLLVISQLSTLTIFSIFLVFAKAASHIYWLDKWFTVNVDFPTVLRMELLICGDSWPWNSICPLKTGVDLINILLYQHHDEQFDHKLQKISLVNCWLSMSMSTIYSQFLKKWLKVLFLGCMTISRLSTEVVTSVIQVNMGFDPYIAMCMRASN